LRGEAAGVGVKILDFTFVLLGYVDYFCSILGNEYIGNFIDFLKP
jgi:hypothetical protein